MPVLFARLYRAALLGYLLNGEEKQRARAYDLGRQAMCDGFSLLDLLRAHNRAVNTLLEATPDTRRVLLRTKAAQDFLLDAVSPYEMVCRGYVASLPSRPPIDLPAGATRRKRRRTVRSFSARPRGIT